MKWIQCPGNVPLRSESGLYQVHLLASPRGHYIAMFRPSLNPIEARSIAEARPTLEEAQADCELHLVGLEAQAAA